MTKGIDEFRPDDWEPADGSARRTASIRPCVSVGCPAVLPAPLERPVAVSALGTLYPVAYDVATTTVRARNHQHSVGLLRQM